MQSINKHQIRIVKCLKQFKLILYNAILRFINDNKESQMIVKSNLNYDDYKTFKESKNIFKGDIIQILDIFQKLLDA